MPNSTPKVDILMATYNGEKYIEAQIQSIFDQTYNNFRILIADDNSHDGTRDILMRYAQADNRVELIFNETNLGVIKNFEQLLSLSDAEYFMLCDQDDVWSLNKVEKSLEKIINENALLVYCDLMVVDQNLNKIHDSFWRYEGIKPIHEISWKLMLSQNVVTGCTIIANKLLIEYALPFPQDLPMHDWYLGITAALHGKLRFINETLIKYRQHNENQIGSKGFLNKSVNYKRYREFLKFRNKLIESRFVISKINWSNTSFDNQELVKFSIYLCIMYMKCLNIKYFDIFFRGFRIKIRYPSQGKLRNLWWVFILSYPYITYIILKILNLFSKLK